ncbi:S-adenosyl-L-methionine-dependent methyltransferase [Desarmillaria tabescens]|uniref:S-adenosyl-L-methionine-dependent methyltransferase n=1 Tax=Armillaria tabescens TaxID=1929756 RepID=A0AA39TQM1_ARMTA|nr:S-adenosyl-L-methionine-dependent methyltransferase [Desarmillaria tabescens]KAK0467097.1 S-adenosyl-L-methionine-dependent methyltransferase [Desarmillaria tabescens]
MLMCSIVSDLRCTCTCQNSSFWLYTVATAFPELRTHPVTVNNCTQNKQGPTCAPQNFPTYNYLSVALSLSLVPLGMPGHTQNVSSYSAEDNSFGSDDSDLVELRSDEFINYFVESNGRLFHSSATSPYPLPVDTPEQQRLNVLHNVLFCMIGAHYVGPVPEILMWEPGRHKIVVDMCTGTGKWVMEMAEQYPHVRFYGFDIVPIATRYPLPNVNFEIHDVGERTRYPDRSIDFVHARSVSMTIRDYRRIIREVSRILRPGGIFVSGEWGQHPTIHPSYNLDPASQTPSFCHFFQLLRDALARRGIPQNVPGTVHSLLQSSGGFFEVTPQTHYFPVGPWSSDHAIQRIGRAFRAVLSRYMDSVRPVILELGVNASDLDDLYAGARAEIGRAQGLVAVYYSVHARRI